MSRSAASMRFAGRELAADVGLLACIGLIAVTACGFLLAAAYTALMPFVRPPAAFAIIGGTLALLAACLCLWRGHRNHRNKTRAAHAAILAAQIAVADAEARLASDIPTAPASTLQTAVFLASFVAARQALR